ncbi:hypothetical protein KC358_g73 [Hortaea werneckii]|nr:hypothetical protein KC358_g73 [Hortaea werneckii]
MPSTFGFFWSMRRRELRLIVSRAEAVVADRAGGGLLRLNVAAILLKGCNWCFSSFSNGEQTLTGIDLFHVDSSRMILIAGILRAYHRTQRDQICHHVRCRRTVALDTSAQFTTIPSTWPSVRELAPFSKAANLAW